MPISMIVASPISGIFSDKHDSRIFSSAGMGIMAVGMFMLCFAGLNTPFWYIVIAMLLAGAGSGMFQTPNNSTIMSSAPKNHRGTVSAVLATFRNIGMVMGVAVSGAVFNFSSGKARTAFAARGMTRLMLKQSAFIKGMQFTILAAVVTALFSMLFALLQGKKQLAIEND
jgi:MFS family permease